METVPLLSMMWVTPLWSTWVPGSACRAVHMSSAHPLGPWAWDCVHPAEKGPADFGHPKLLHGCTEGLRKSIIKSIAVNTARNSLMLLCLVLLGSAALAHYRVGLNEHKRGKVLTIWPWTWLLSRGWERWGWVGKPLENIGFAVCVPPVPEGHPL